MVKGLSNLSKFSLLILICFFESCFSNNSSNVFYKGNLGLNIEIKKQKYFYREDGAPNEGFSFEIQSFSTKKGNLIAGNDYPLTYESKRDWGVYKWKKTPFNDENYDLDLLFKYDIRDSLLKAHVLEVKKLLSSNQGYISFFYKKEGKYLYSIECYLLDLGKKEIYTIKVLT